MSVLIGANDLDFVNDPHAAEKMNLVRIRDCVVRLHLDIETDHMRSDSLVATGWSCEQFVKTEENYQ